MKYLLIAALVVALAAMAWMFYQLWLYLAETIDGLPEMDKGYPYYDDEEEGIERL